MRRSFARVFVLVSAILPASLIASTSCKRQPTDSGTGAASSSGSTVASAAGSGSGSGMAGEAFRKTPPKAEGHGVFTPPKIVEAKLADGMRHPLVQSHK